MEENESRINKEVRGQFILDKMLCGTDCIIYAKKHQFIDKQGTINYYKVVTIDTKGHISKYIKDLSTPNSKWFMGLL